jgi:hypothetical protein
MRSVQGVIRLTFLCIVWLTLFHVDALHAKELKRPVDGPLIIIHTPHLEQLEIALDEVELEWTDLSEKKLAPAESPRMIHGSRVVKSETARAVVAVTGIASPMDLSMMATSLKAANPGAEAHLILYEPGLPRSTATRRLLTREVGVVLEQGEDPQSLLTGISTGSVRSVPGVPEGYIVEASDPMAALSLADALRRRPGVRSAYPLLKRAYFPR